MNKLFVILALLAFMPAEANAESIYNDSGAFVLAKAVKLGRGKAYSVAADSNVNTGTGQTELRKGECESDDECPSDKKCLGYKCVDVCTQPTGNGVSYGRICAGQKCVANPDQPHSFKCVDNCYNVVCKSGYTTEVTSDGCCCVADTPTCSGAQVYNAFIGKCVDAVCPTGCSSDCKVGYCISCDSGRYLSYDTGLCPTCSSAIANCATCTSSSSGVTCTACDSGYTLSGGKCVADDITMGDSDDKCQLSNCSTCSSSTTCTKCDSGYYLSSGTCKICPLNATCTGTSSFTCKTGYVKYNNTCRLDPCDGISTTPAWCQDGLERVVGKGCCRPGYTSTTQCLQCAVLEPALATD